MNYSIRFSPLKKIGVLEILLGDFWIWGHKGMPTTKLKFTETTKFKKGPQDRNLTGLNSKKQELGKTT